jgi:O-antigen ligase
MNTSNTVKARAMATLGYASIGLFLMLVGAFVAVANTFALVVFAPVVAVALGVWFFKLAKGEDEFQHGLHRMLYWCLAINLPTFLAFDRTGLTRAHGLFNAQSLSRIALFLAITCLIGISLTFTTRARRGVALADTPVLLPTLSLPLVIYGWYALNAPMVSGGTDLLLALFRVSEWLLLLILLWALLRDSLVLGKASARDLLGLALPIILFPTLVNVVVFPFAPHLVYQTSEATGIARFGALFTHPNVLGALTAMAVFYAWSYWRGWLRASSVVLMLALLFLSYSRGAIIAFTVATLVYVFVLAQSATTRVWLVIAGLCGGLLIFGFGDAIVDAVRTYFERNHSAGKLASLSERTIVWSAATTMIQSDPWLGYGFVSGPKKLADVMATGATGSYFVAPHAHNELLQTQLSGGVLASALAIILYLRTAFLLIKAAQFEDRKFIAVMSAWLVVLLLFGVLQPMLSQPVAIIGALMLHAYVTLELVCSRHTLNVKPALGQILSRSKPLASRHAQPS